jgi:hypothetical protein
VVSRLPQRRKEGYRMAEGEACSRGGTPAADYGSKLQGQGKVSWPFLFVR